MKRGATREDIIRTTQELIVRNGIRAVRVDEIAQRLGISKRTLYEKFADKTDLMDVCLEEIGRRQRERITAYRRVRSKAPLRLAWTFLQNYINVLFSVDNRFLKDIRGKLCFSERFSGHREFCRKELAQILKNGQQAELILNTIDPENLSDRMLDTLLELRLNHVSQEELYLFCRTMLRGASTRLGIDQIDRNS